MTSSVEPPETNGPPLVANEDLLNTSKPLEDVQLPIDTLLLTVKDCEFLSCLSYLNSFIRYCDDKLGIIYIGDMGDERKIAVIKCDKGSSGTGGSTVVVKNAVEVLGPKAVFCVGFCGGLNSQKVKLGDVVVSAKLITYAPSKVLEGSIEECGVRAPVPQRILKLIKHVADGWKAPLKDPKKLKVDVHRNGVFLSGPELVDNNERRMELVERFPDAIAIEMEGEGLYAAAHDLDVPWIIIKGVSDFADGDKTKTSSWREFASFMAASIVANILHDSTVFKKWPHYGDGSGYERPNKRPIASDASAAHSDSDRKRSKWIEESEVVKDGIPTDRDLQRLSTKIDKAWENLGRQLEMDDSKLVKFDKENDGYTEKPYKMLLHWKQRDGKAATYQVLYDALTDELVNRRSLAEEICLVDTS